MLDKLAALKLPKWLIPATAIALLLLVILFALGAFTGGKIAPGNTPPDKQTLPGAIQTLKVSKHPEANTLSWQGTVRSRLTVKIAPKLNARITEVLVHPGDRLKKGDVIARLDDRDLRAASDAANAAYAAAAAQAAQARSEEKRISRLYSKQAATKQNYDAVLAQSRAASALASQASSSAQQTHVMVGENVLYAPFDGIVGGRLHEPGDMGMTDQPIVTLFKPGDLRLEAPVTNTCSALLKQGMKVSVRIDVLKETLTATVDEITPEIDPQTHTQQIKLSLPQTPSLQQGQFGWLELACESEQDALLIPASAIVHYGQLQAVKVLEGGQLHVRHIRTGKQLGDQMEVLSGLQEGEIILVEGGLTP